MIKKTLKNLFSSKIDLDRIKLENDLDSLFIRFGSDKGSLDGKKTFSYFSRLKKNNSNFVFKNYKNWVNRENLLDYEYQLGLKFAPIYEKFFHNLKNEKIKFLEIGVANGHSLASFYKYFNKSEIFGIDKKDSSKLFYKGKRLKYFNIDILNKNKIINFTKKHTSFNIIIDDSLHNEIGILTNFVNFYESLSSGGYYIIEDFKYNDLYKELEMKFNKENNSSYLGLSSFTIGNFFSMLNDKNREVYTLIDQKPFFESSILSKSFLDQVFDTLEFSKPYFSDHPWSSMIVIKKK
jgi:hypothetical protein